MGNIVLPSYVPVKYKAGYSGGIGRAEQIQVVRQQYQVCLSCKDGPRCIDTHLKKSGLEVEDGSPGASTARTAHRRDRPGLAHPDGGGGSRSNEEEFNKNVTDLIEKWEEAGGGDQIDAEMGIMG